MTTTSPMHTRTYEFEGRLPDPATMLSMSGLDYLSAVMRGEQPAAPIAQTLGFTPPGYVTGHAVFERATLVSKVAIDASTPTRSGLWRRIRSPSDCRYDFSTGSWTTESVPSPARADAAR